MALRLGGGLVVFFVGRHGLKVFCFKYLVAIQAPDIIDPVAPRQNLGTTVIAGLHIEIKPILSAPIPLSSPQSTPVGLDLWLWAIVSPGTIKGHDSTKPRDSSLRRAFPG